MKISLTNLKRKLRGGYALAMVLIFAAIGLALLAPIISRTTTNAALTTRNNQYFDAVEASEAATEKVIAELSADFLSADAATVKGKMNIYKSRKPEKAENARWSHFAFKDTHGNKDATEVDLVSDWATVPLLSQYQGLKGYAATYRITSRAQNLDGANNITGSIQQDLQLATVPLFQFAIFYNVNLEICPGPDMTISGRVHGNNNIYLQPQAKLKFLGDVTSSGDIIANKSPDDPSIRAPGTITFNGAHDGGVSTLNLPIGTNNSPDAVHAIIEIPPNGESPNSLLGQQRLYNQADLLILTYDDHVDVHGGNNNNGNGANVQWKEAKAFVATNVTFYDYREQKTIKTTQIDVGQLSNWMNTNKSGVKSVQSVYVADLRTQNSSTEPGVRLINGQTLPTDGLTIATADPLYVQGNYNVVTSALGTTNTSQSKPAALVADSINVLSGSWSDANSSKSLSNRNASDTTVNAAFLAGIVPSGNGYYSGGVENFPRFLEDWSGNKFTYNGSMVVMFPSKIAKAPWKGTGGTWNIYNPPTRNWNFDLNFTDPTKLPPLTPAVRITIRGAWTAVSAN